MISGPAGTGKGTVISELINSGLRFAYSVSATTREPRAGEVDGVNYNFITRSKFEEFIKTGEVAEYFEYCGNYYGTLRREIESKRKNGFNLILEIEVNGALNIKRAYPESVLVFLLPPDYETIESRLRGRGTSSEEDIKKRMSRAAEEIKFLPEYDYVVFNRDGLCSLAAAEIIEIVRSEKRRTFRNPGIAEFFLSKQ